MKTVSENSSFSRQFLHLLFSVAVLLLLFIFSSIFIFSSTNVHSNDGNDGVGGIGWVSFNCDDVDTCTDGPYGVVLDPENGDLSGSAWANPFDSNAGLDPMNPNSGNQGTSTFGKLQFGDLSGFPTTGYGTYPGNATIDWDEGSPEARPVVGWARFETGAEAEDGWDGWVSMSGQDINGDSYGVYFNNDPGSTGYGEFSGFAWGGDTVGWLSFDPQNHGGTGEGVSLENPVECFLPEDEDEFEFSLSVSNVTIGIDDLGSGSNTTRADVKNETPQVAGDVNITEFVYNHLGVDITFTTPGDIDCSFEGGEAADDECQVSLNITAGVDLSGVVFNNQSPLAQFIERLFIEKVFADNPEIPVQVTAFAEEVDNPSNQDSDEFTLTIILPVDEGPGPGGEDTEAPDVVCLSDYHYDDFNNGYGDPDDPNFPFPNSDAKPADEDGVHRAPIGAPITWGLFKKYDTETEEGGELIEHGDDITVNWSGAGFPDQGLEGNPSGPVIYSTVGAKGVTGTATNEEEWDDVAECELSSLQLIPLSDWEQF